MLTDIACKKSVAQDKPYRVFDGGGLYLEVSPTGSKYWRLKYRYQGKEKRLALGVYPDTSLKAARELAGDAKRQLKEGKDPSMERKLKKLFNEISAENNFEAIAREWLANRSPNLTEKHVNKLLSQLENDVFPWLGKKPATSISAPELLLVLRKVEKRGAVHTARRLLNTVGHVLRYGVATGRCERNVATDLKGALKEESPEHRAAITDPKKLGELLRAIDGYEGSMIARCALQLVPLVFVRPGELRHAEWAEIDLDKAEWNIPAGKMKMRSPHLVPLSKEAVKIFREIHELTGTGTYVFPSQRSSKRPISDNTLNAALRRMGFDTQKEMSAHGFRATARTILDEVLGFRPDIIEHQLAHAVRDPNGRAYNRTSHLPERRKMMQLWSNFLGQIKTGASISTLPHRAA